MANPWFKFYGAEYLGDPKIDQLTPLERSCWLTLLCLANVANDNGAVHNLKVFTLLTKSGIYPLDSGAEQMGLKDDYNDTIGVLEHFQELGMVERIDTFSYQIKNWEKRQETALTAAERQAKYRENRKSNEKVTERVTKVTLDKIRIDKNNTRDSALPIEEVQETSSDLRGDSGDSKSPRISGDKRKAYDELIAWSEKERGFAFPKTERLKQYRAFKLANTNDLTRDRLVEMWEEMSTEKFWQKAGYDWMNVVQQCLKKPI